MKQEHNYDYDYDQRVNSLSVTKDGREIAFFQDEEAAELFEVLESAKTDEEIQQILFNCDQ